MLRLGENKRDLDRDALTRGERLEVPDLPGVAVWVLAMSPKAPRVKKALTRFMRLTGRLSSGKISDEEAGLMMMEAMYDPTFLVDAIIRDIEGIYDEKGPVEYSREVGLKILDAPENEDVLGWLGQELSARFAKRAKELEETGNDSAPASNGSKAGGAKSRKTKSSAPT